ncbi:hypothetical protein [Streptomyces finlayi]|nr:hypothetical protein [Streptomyces finlayi]
MTVLLTLAAGGAIYGMCWLLWQLRQSHADGRDDISTVCGWIRAVVTTVVVVGTAVVYGVRVGSGAEVVNAFSAKYIIGGGCAVLLLILMTGVVTYFSPSDQRAQVLRNLVLGDGTGGPLAFLGLLAAGVGLIAWSMSMMDTMDRNWVGFVAFPIVPGWLVFLVGGAVVGLTSMFGAHTVHPSLPALVGPGFAIAALVVDKVSGAPTFVQAPENVADLLGFAGVTALVVLSVVEYLLLKREYGVSLTSGPVPAGRH